MKTLKKVKACPENYLNFQDRNKTMYCDSYPQCNGHELFYHCVKFEDGLAEVCAPRSVITGTNYVQVYLYVCSLKTDDLKSRTLNPVSAKI